MEKGLYGLYDTDGVLRFTDGDREACLAYAALFDLKSFECSLMSLPEPKEIPFKGQRKLRRQAMNSN